MIDPTRFEHLTRQFHAAALRRQEARKALDSAEREWEESNEQFSDAQASLYDYCNEAAGIKTEMQTIYLR